MSLALRRAARGDARLAACAVWQPTCGVRTIRFQKGNGFPERFIQKCQACRHLAVTLKTMAASLQELLANRNSWGQAIKLELFEGQKNIFGDSYPAQAPRKKEFAVISGAITPVPLYEFELRELFVEATMKSGCRWWCRRSDPSNASQRVRRTLWSVDLVCRHQGKDFDKKAVDDSRASRHLVRCSCPASCKLRAVQVQIVASLPV